MASRRPWVWSNLNIIISYAFFLCLLIGSATSYQIVSSSAVYDKIQTGPSNKICWSPTQQKHQGSSKYSTQTLNAIHNNNANENIRRPNNQPDNSSRLQAFLNRIVEFWIQFYVGFINRRLFQLQKLLRRLVERCTVYILECENDKYYVGHTTRRKQRLQQHLGDRGGSLWTRKHKPIRIVEEYRIIPSQYSLGVESRVTAEYMLRYGVNNVRGAMFCDNRIYTSRDVDALTRFLGHYNDMNYKDVRDSLQSTLPSPNVLKKSKKKQRKERKLANANKSKEQYTFGDIIKTDKADDRCFQCGQLGHWAMDCPNGDGPTCYACGKSGHFARDCPSRKLLRNNTDS